MANKIVDFIKKYLKKNHPFPSYIQNASFQKWFILISLCFVLSFLLTPKLHLTHPEYRVGLIANKDVRADRDFLVEDRESTEQKKMDQVKSILSVYDYDVDAALQIKDSFSRAFLIGSSVYQSLDGEQNNLNTTKLAEMKKGFEKALGVTIRNDEFVTLNKYKFSAAIFNKINKLITVLYNSGLILDKPLIGQDINKDIIIKNIKTKTEEIRNFSSLRYIKNVRAILLEKGGLIFSKPESDVKLVAISLIGRLAQPNLTLNKDETEQRKQAFIKTLKSVSIPVQKDEIIIRKGERIDSKDLDKLEAFFRINEEGKFSNIAAFTGIFLMIMFLSLSLYYLSSNWLNKSNNNVDILCFSLIAIIQIIIAKTGILISEASNHAFSFFSLNAYYYAIPYTMGAMLISILINRNVALIFSIFSSFLTPFLFDEGISILWFSFLGCIVASYNIGNYKKRSLFFKTGLLLGLINGGIIIFQSLLSDNIALIDIASKIFMGITGGLFSVIIVVGIIPLFESVFSYTTDIKLLELANLNQPIFQQMILEAPGTYHHSIVVGSMAESASEAIGANSLLAKVSGYYHDIGKLKKAQYFIENQRNGENRHDKLSPKMSSLVIISHVKDGCELAKKTKLGNEIINIIQEHHGTSLVSYFYDKAKKNSDPSIRSLPETDFRYPGPKPQTKEAGLVLLGDVLEASSRSLSNPTPARINNLVNERIEKVFMDGQLDECELTLHDLNKIAECFTRILNGVFHHRIDYPQQVVQEFNDVKRNNYGSINKKSSEKNKN